MSLLEEFKKRGRMIQHEGLLHIWQQKLKAELLNRFRWPPKVMSDSFWSYGYYRDYCPLEARVNLEISKRMRKSLEDILYGRHKSHAHIAHNRRHRANSGYDFDNMKTKLEKKLQHPDSQWFRDHTDIPTNKEHKHHHHENRDMEMEAEEQKLAKSSKRPKKQSLKVSEENIRKVSEQQKSSMGPKKQNLQVAEEGLQHVSSKQAKPSKGPKKQNFQKVSPQNKAIAHWLNDLDDESNSVSLRGRRNSRFSIAETGKGKKKLSKDIKMMKQKVENESEELSTKTVSSASELSIVPNSYEKGNQKSKL